MAALVDRINSGLAELRHRDQSLSINDWADYFTFGGNTYPVVQTTMGTVDREQVGFTSVAGFKGSGPIFSLVLARLQVFSQVRFQWTRFAGSQPTELFGTPELGVLERPWRGGTTSDLLARMEVHASVAGCAYVTRPRADRLSLLRPDRVIIIMGSETDAEDPSEAPDAEIIGFVHETSRGKMTFFDPDQVAYYAPIPDPDYRFLGMSWITPVIRDLQADSLATEHKARFFVNSATPNLAIKFDASLRIEQVRQFKELLESEHKGAFNAWKTLYLGGGADPVTVGNSFKDMDYAVIQGRAESRLASAAGVPPSWVGFAEGLQGSSLNAGNFNSARRRFSDGTMIHLWTSAATSLEVLLSRPSGAALWYDPRVPFMREDAGDLADIQQKQASTIAALVREGFTSESAIAAVTKNDFSLLVHTGMLSVQLQPPGANPAAGEQVPKGPAAKAARHRPGLHDQSKHGRPGVKGLAKKAVKAAVKKALDGDGASWTGDVTPAKSMFARGYGSDPTPEQLATMQKVFGGEHAGFRIKDLQMRFLGTDAVDFDGGIYDKNGARVGYFSRQITKDPDGNLIAMHDKLQLQRQVQGQGFAEAFNGRLIEWYRASGVKQIQLTANIDVGGYAWARAGYDWLDEDSTDGPRTWLKQLARGSRRVPEDRLAEQTALAVAMLKRFETAKFGSPDYPTPFEVSQLGRWPGAGKSDEWVGKIAMLSSSWDGVKPL